MKFSSMLKTARKNRKPASSRKARPRRFEALEDRRVFDVSAALVGTELIISGDQFDSQVTISQDDDNRDGDRTLVVTINDVNGRTVENFRSSRITKVTANMLGGQDTVDYRLVSNLENDKVFDINLGDGHDSFNVYGTRTLEDDLTLDVDGGSGNDTFWANFGDVRGVNLTVKADLGVGDDRAPIMLNGSLLDDAFASFDLKGGIGNDRLSVDYARTSATRINNRADLVVSLDGGEGTDILTFAYNGENHGEITTKFVGGNGYDYASDNFNPNQRSSTRARVFEQSGIQEWRTVL